MKDLLFKAKEVDNTGWIYGSLIEDKYIVGKVIEFNEDYFNTEYWWTVIPETVCQYTGKGDDGEDKIFKGDILYFEYEGKSYDDGVVVWDETKLQWAIRHNELEDLVPLAAAIEESTAVTGNIYDLGVNNEH